MMAFSYLPPLYDIGVLITHVVLTFVVDTQTRDEILDSTDFKTYYRKHIYDEAIEKDGHVHEANAWTIWNSIHAAIAVPQMLFTSLMILGCWYNPAIVFGYLGWNDTIIFAFFKVIDFLFSFTKIFLIIFSNAEFQDDNTLDMWTKNKWYLWDDTQREWIYYELFATAGKAILWLASIAGFGGAYFIPNPLPAHGGLSVV